MEDANELLRKLEELNQEHLTECSAVMEAFGGSIYPFDLLTFGVLNRSMSLTTGFISLIRGDNYIAAATLVRPQLDTFLRYAAGWLVENPHQFANEIMNGTPVRNQKTITGKSMTDRFLVDHFKNEHPWIERVYRETSGFVHLSEKHIMMTVMDTDKSDKTVTHFISGTQPHLPPQIRKEAIEGFSEITKLILHRVYSWRYTKDNPPKHTKNAKN